MYREIITKVGISKGCKKKNHWSEGHDISHELYRIRTHREIQEILGVLVLEIS